MRSIVRILVGGLTGAAVLTGCGSSPPQACRELESAAAGLVASQEARAAAAAELVAAELEGLPWSEEDAAEADDAASSELYEAVMRMSSTALAVSETSSARELGLEGDLASLSEMLEGSRVVLTMGGTPSEELVKVAARVSEVCGFPLLQAG